MLDALSWFLALEALGLVALPFVFVLFRGLPDRGVTLAKPAALVCFSYVLWILGLTRLVPNTQLTIVILLVVGAVGAAVLAWRVWPELGDFLRRRWPLFLASEAVFIGLFLLWAGIISGAPEINHTEKPMDFGFLNAVLQSRFFPPEDPWLSGYAISYYYFGHFMMAFLTQLTGVASSVGYNLSVACIPALAGIGAFGLVYNLVRLSGAGVGKSVAFGAAAPVLILLAGNLEGALEFVKVQGWAGNGFWEWAGIKGLGPGVSTGVGAFPDQYWWWFRASRVIDTVVDGQSLDYTITEFPVFSFILGDLHPHVVALPFVLLGLALALNVLCAPGNAGRRWLLDQPWLWMAAALFIGSLAFINTWDFPTMIALLAAAALLKSYREGDGDLREAAVATAVVMLPVFALSVMLFAPFYAGLETQASGVLPLREVATRPFLLFLVMGLFIALAVGFLARQLGGAARLGTGETSAAVLVALLALTPAVVWAVAVFVFTVFSDGTGAAFDELGRRAVLVVPGALIVAAAWHCAAQRTLSDRSPAVVFALLLTGLGFYLMMGAELFYVVDSFGGGFRRMNTVFKVYYQVWLILGVVAAYAMYYLWGRSDADEGGPIGIPVRRTGLAAGGLRAGKYLAGVAVALLLAASFYYPLGAALERTGMQAGKPSFGDNTLDGLAFLKQGAPGEYEAIRWLRDEAPWGRMVEAVGDDYSGYGRISSSTGLPTVLGWKGHELQWRGSAEPFAGREEAVARIYGSDDPAVVRELLESFGVRYVYLGQRERSSYGVADLSRFDGFLTTAFEADGVIIYEVIPITEVQDSRAPG